VKVLVYLGPSLDVGFAKEIVPDAVFLPPASHADIISDVPKYNPTHILLIDGVFDSKLPVWHKELSWAALKGIKVYGSSSMGALRASELADVGVMIGSGKIFEWYHEGVIDADDEVAVIYHQTPSGNYVCDTCPLVNLRAGLLRLIESEEITPEEAGEIFKTEQGKHYTERLTSPDSRYVFDQKREDALHLLSNFLTLDYCTDKRPDLTYMTMLFNAMLERERRVEHAGATITMQHVDSYITLNCPQYNQICWDSKNRALAVILADILHVAVTKEDIEYEWSTFCARNRLVVWDQYLDWLNANAMTPANFEVMTIQNARIRKLHETYITTCMFRRQTQTILDYMRTHNQLQMWLDDCADAERIIVDRENTDTVGIDFTENLQGMFQEHLEATGLEIAGTLDNYLRETGISSVAELRVCLSRLALARKGPEG
jgi:hypothetical protein